MTRSLHLLALVATLAACGDATKPPTEFDPYALFYFRNDAPGSPTFAFYTKFPNRTPPDSTHSGSAGPGEVTCGGFGLPTVIAGDPQNMIQVVIHWPPAESWPAGTYASPVVDPFDFGPNTPQTAHRFRLWLKADSTLFFDHGEWNDSTRWAAEPGWPCPTSF